MPQHCRSTHSRHGAAHPQTQHESRNCSDVVWSSPARACEPMGAGRDGDDGDEHRDSRAVEDDDDDDEYLQEHSVQGSSSSDSSSSSSEDEDAAEESVNPDGVAGQGSLGQGRAQGWFGCLRRASQIEV